MTSTRSKKQVKPKVPKGYTDEYTTYELITKTTYSKPYKMGKIDKPKKRSKAAKARDDKKNAKPVRIVSDTRGKTLTKAASGTSKRSRHARRILSRRRSHRKRSTKLSRQDKR